MCKHNNKTGRSPLVRGTLDVSIHYYESESDPKSFNTNKPVMIRTNLADISSNEYPSIIILKFKSLIEWLSIADVGWA